MQRLGISVGLATVIVGMALLAAPARATIVGPPLWCAADCNGDQMVAINEIITCINVLLGSSPTAACPACDGDGDGIIGINDLVQAVATALSILPCPDAPPSPCGDGALAGAEECDDGNTFGGDGCAANCTLESLRSATVELRPQTSALPQVQRGQLVLRTGRGLEAAVGSLPRGALPVALRADELRFEPEHITGLVCACTRAVPRPELGPGVAGAGWIGCAPEGATDVDYRIIQDHNTTPGEAHNRERGTPDDPECDDTAPGPAGAVSRACREGSADSCPGWADAAAHPHAGVCNGPRVLTISGGTAARGSAQIALSVATTLLADAGACATTRPMRDGACLYPDYGADCLPCTDDDAPGPTWADLVLLTTGTAEGVFYDRNNGAPTRAAAGGGSGPFCPPLCVAGPTAPFDCEALAARPSGGLEGAALAFASPVLDASLGDTVVSGVLSFPGE